MACVSLVLDVLEAGTSCYQFLPVVTGAEWRLGLYKHSDSLFEMLFDLISPVPKNQFFGQFGLYHLLERACQTVLYRVSRADYDVNFEMPEIFLSSKFFENEIKNWK